MSGITSQSNNCECNCHVLQENCEECLILHGIESLESVTNENQVDTSMRRRGTDEEINERRQKIFETITNYPNTTQETLAVMFSVSVSTIQRDLDALKDNSLEWADDLIRGGFLHKVKTASSRIDNHISRLQHRIDHEDLDPKTEAYLMQKINDFANYQLNKETIVFMHIMKTIDDKLATLPKNFTLIR